jgi:beta-glucosidase
MRSVLFSATKLSVALAALTTLICAAGYAADETCALCDKKLSFSGDFTHRRAPGRTVVQGAPAGMEDTFREGIYGRTFSATLTGLPAGKYTIVIGEMEADADTTNTGVRAFDVTAGDQVLARNFDIIATAGGADKVTFIKGTVDHQIDSVGGPLVVSFTGQTGQAKMNSFEVRDPASDTSILLVQASDLRDQSDLAAGQVPQVAGPALWTDPTQPRAVRIKDLVSRLSLQEKAAQMGNGAPAIHRAGLDLPAYNYWSEALHGVARDGTATVFPQAIGNGATWDPNFVKQMGHIIGVEGRAKNNDIRARRNGNSGQFQGLNFWSPNINIFRDPRWGRGQETYGEDTFLTSRMGVAFIQGLQGDDPNYVLALACAKHYAVHSGPEALRHRFDVHPSERDLYETYLPHFEAAVREGHVGAIMSAYNAVDGEPAPSSTFLLTDTLRTRWGFDGQVVSDCDAVGDIWRNHHTVNSAAEAAARAVKGGTDLCCGQTYNNLVTSVRSNLITVGEIDTALGRIFESRFKLGLFDPSNMVPYTQITLAQNDTAEHRQVALQLARESMVLLKNEGILPLDRSKLKHIAVIGPNAGPDAGQMLFGNYNGTNPNTTSILDGIRQVAGSNIDVQYTIGCPLAMFTAAAQRATPAQLAWGVSNSLALASNSDLVIYVGGINSTMEGEEGTRGNADGFANGDRTQIELPDCQEDLLRALYATGKPVIMINCSGSAMAIPWEAEHLPAILQAWYPGEQGGQAVAETLFGDYNPGGRLPITFYRTTADLPAFTNYSMENRTYRYYTGLPLYAFGHGLSYSYFDYSAPVLASKKVKAGDTITVQFKVTNKGQRDGDEVAQVYFRHVNSAVPQPIEALCAFGRVHIPAGQTAQISLNIPAERLRYWDTTREDYTVETGNYEFMIGAASDDIRQRIPFSVVQ